MKTYLLSIILLHLLSHITTAEPVNRHCDTWENDNELEYQCTPITHQDGNNVMVVIVKKLHRQINIECSQNFTNFVEVLPEIHFPNLEKVMIKFCQLPNNDYFSVLRTLNLENVKSLSISGIKREPGKAIELGRSLFKGLETLEFLQITESEDVIIRDNFLAEFPNLNTLNLYNNKFRNLERLNFSMLPKLEHLTMAKANVEEVYPGWFAGLDQVKTLHLFNNNITFLNGSSFVGLDNLQAIELSNNLIEVIEGDTFLNMPKLVNVSLLSNKLGTIGTKLFENNKKLYQIRLGGNLGLTLEEEALSNLPSLKIVNLSGCNIVTLPENVFSGSSNILDINLSNNKLSSLPNFIFDGLNLVTTLDLSNNNISTLDDALFEPLLNLKELKLNNNQLTTIGTYALKNQNHLQVLSLHHNMIKNVSAQALSNLTDLIELDLSYNDLRFINDNNLISSPFSKSLRLQKINFSHNKFVQWDSFYMPTSVSLTHVDVTFNKITDLNIVGLFENVFTSEVEIDFSNNEITKVDAFLPSNYFDTNILLKLKIGNNPITCDCYNYLLISHLQGEVDLFNVVNFLDYDTLTCSSPKEFAHFKLTEMKRDLISCPIEDVHVDQYECHDRCGCFWKPFYSAFVMDCSNQNLTKIPHFLSPGKVLLKNTVTRHLVKSVEVYVDNNNLTKGPTKADNYDNVTTLVLSHNKIKTLDFIPTNLSILRLDHNNLSRLKLETIKQLNSSQIRNVTLDGNPWICDCEAKTFKDYLFNRKDQIDSNNIRCIEDSERIIENVNLCRSQQDAMLAAFVAILILLFIISVIIALFYKYQMEVKVWLYSKNLCLWFVTEEELDKDKIFDVFISFSHKEDDFVLKTLLPALESGQNPYKVCIHYRDFIPGETINNQVAKSVNDSRRTLVVLTNNFIESCWSKMEFRMAHTRAIQEGRARVIIVIYGDVDESKMDDELKAYLRTNTYIKWGDPWFWQRLTYALPHQKESKFSQKHANIMLKIDKKFDIIPSYPPQSTPPILSLDAKLLSSYPYSTHKLMESPTTDSGGPLIINTIK